MRLRIGLLIVLLTVVSAAACESNADRGPHYQSSVAEPRTTGALPSPEEALQSADMLRNSGAYAEALSILAEAYQRFPGNSAIISAYGRLALLGGDDKLANRLLHEAVASDPQDWRALSALGVLDSRRGQQTAARDTLTKASAASGGNAAAINNLAISELLHGRTASAIALLRQALASPSLKEQHQPRIKRNLALALAVDGRFEEADALAGEDMPRSLYHADGEAIRDFLGLPVKAAPVSDRPQEYSGNSWRPADDPSDR